MGNSHRRGLGLIATLIAAIWDSWALIANFITAGLGSLLTRGLRMQGAPTTARAGHAPGGGGGGARGDGDSHGKHHRGGAPKVMTSDCLSHYSDDV